MIVLITFSVIRAVKKGNRSARRRYTRTTSKPRFSRNPNNQNRRSIPLRCIGKSPLIQSGTRARLRTQYLWTISDYLVDSRVRQTGCAFVTEKPHPVRPVSTLVRHHPHSFSAK